MMRERVVIVAAGMAGDVAAEVDAACRRAAVTPVRWAGHETLPRSAQLVVAALKAGCREIPQEVIDLVELQAPGAPLLLLADEPLVRPALTIQDGRITLLGRPFLGCRVYSQLRLLLGGREGSAARATAHHCGQMIFATRERLRRSFWTAEIAVGKEEDRGTRFPEVHLDSLEAMTAVLPFEATFAISNRERERILETLHAQACDGDRGAELAHLLGTKAGLVGLTARASEWVVYWPSAALPLWMYSPVRLPRFRDLAGHRSDVGRRMVRFPAFSGDLTVALSSSLAGSGSATSELAALMDKGGPAFLDYVEAQCGGHAAVAGLLAEVR
jgi:hypothetical protein